MTESRVTCKRHHRLFEITPDGIAIKCRAGECRTVYTIPWSEIEAKRAALYTVTQSSSVLRADDCSLLAERIL